MLGVKKMWSFELEHKVTGELNLVVGHDWKKECIRKGLNPDEWVLISYSYED